MKKWLVICLIGNLSACGGGDEQSGFDSSASRRHISAANNTYGTTGRWSSVANWPLVAVHVALLPDGRVFSYGSDGKGAQSGKFIYDIWNPDQGMGAESHLTLPNYTGADTFCSAQVLLPESGNLLVAGGDNTGAGGLSDNTGNLDVLVLKKDVLTRSPQGLNRARWYPTLTTLSDGRVLVEGGATVYQPVKAPTLTPEIYTPGRGFQLLPDATSSVVYGDSIENRWWYPRSWVAPDGRVFGISGSQMYYLDPNGSGSISLAGVFSMANKGATSTAIMYRPGKILQAGGGDYSNNASGRSGSRLASIIDISSGSPSIQPTGAMNYERHWPTSTMLPNGDVLVTSGAKGNDRLDGVAYPAEIWNPQTGTWKVMASASRPRMYHNTALLLPDASVLVTGGGAAKGQFTELNAEVFYPPYLYDASGNLAVRPVISSVPNVVKWGDKVSVEYSSTSSIGKATLVRTGSVTHSFSMDGRFMELPMTVTQGKLLIDIPSSRNILPPGYYMLFLVDSAGVPSKAKVIKIWDETVFPGLDSIGADFATSLTSGGFENVGYNAPSKGWINFASGSSIGSWSVTQGNVDLTNFHHNGEGHAGSSGVHHLDLSGSNAAGKIAQRIYGLTVGDRYAMTVRYSRHPFAGKTNARIKIADLDRSWSAVNSGVPSAEITQGWYGARFEFTASSSAHDLTLEGLDVGWYGMLIDDISISRVSRNIVSNGDFEIGGGSPSGVAYLYPGQGVGLWMVSSGVIGLQSNWLSNYGMGLDSDSGYATGGYHINLMASGSLTQTLSGLTPGRRYVVSLKAASTDASGKSLVSATLSVAGKSFVLNRKNSGSKRWQASSMIFTATTGQHNLLISAGGSSGNGTMLVDDVVVYPIQ